MRLRFNIESISFWRFSTKTTSEDPKKLKVTMVAWNLSDEWVITAVSDFSLKVWSPTTGELVKVLTGHTDEVYVLESHPHDAYVVLSAGHDGQLFIWDLNRGEIVYRFLNTIEGQGYGAIFDVKWGPDGRGFSASDSHGHILTFGFGTGSVFFEQVTFKNQQKNLTCLYVYFLFLVTERTILSHGLQAFSERCQSLCPRRTNSSSSTSHASSIFSRY